MQRSQECQPDTCTTRRHCVRRSRTCRCKGMVRASATGSSQETPLQEWCLFAEYVGPVDPCPPKSTLPFAYRKPIRDAQEVSPLVLVQRKFRKGSKLDLLRCPGKSAKVEVFQAEGHPADKVGRRMRLSLAVSRVLPSRVRSCCIVLSMPSHAPSPLPAEPGLFFFSTALPAKAEAEAPETSAEGEPAGSDVPEEADFKPFGINFCDTCFQVYHLDKLNESLAEGTAKTILFFRGKDFRGALLFLTLLCSQC